MAMQYGSNSMSWLGVTEPPQCMPDKYKCEDPVQAYRNYYLGEKMYMAVWTERDVNKHGYNKNRQCSFRKKIIITDLDGTISDCTHRLKYYRKNDYFKFNELGSEDLPITPIVNILRNLQN